MHTNHADRKKTGTTLNDFDIHAHTTCQVNLRRATGYEWLP